MGRTGTAGRIADHCRTKETACRQSGQGRSYLVRAAPHSTPGAGARASRTASHMLYYSEIEQLARDLMGDDRRAARILSFCWHSLSITIETPTYGRGGCSRVTVSPTARR